MKEIQEVKADNQDVFKEQEKLALIGLLLEIPSLIILSVSSFRTFSPLVCIDCLDSLCFVIQGSIICITSKKLQRDIHFEYNYGTERIELISSLACDILLCIGTIGIASLSVVDLFHPKTQSSFLLYVVILKIVEVLIDAYIFVKQAGLLKKNNSAVVRTEYFSALKDVAFDFLSLLLIGACYLFRNNIVTSYFASIAALMICAVFMISRIKDMRRNMDALTDKTLDEDYQLDILKVLNNYDSKYTSFLSVKSHQLGDTLFVDFYLEFSPRTSYEEIRLLKSHLEQDLQSKLGDCKVSIVIGH